jgi:LmbE family N-acetylglucosaminyl deacetylase
MQVTRVGCLALRTARTVPVAIANRRAESRVAHDPGGPLLLLSPHLDDSVLNCWSVLTGPNDVRVVNVFAGVPASGQLTQWDRVCGAAESATQMRMRLVEDAKALGLAGRAATNLPFLDHMYRRCVPPPSLSDLDDAVSRLVPAASGVYAPVGVDHRDHRLVRRYAALIGRNGVPLQLYADLPYATRFGWPDWVTGRPSDPHLDVDAHWETNPFIPDRRGARVVALGDQRSAAKLAALRAYRSQLPALDAGPLEALSNPGIHGFEVFWEVQAVEARTTSANRDATSSSAKWVRT